MATKKPIANTDQIEIPKTIERDLANTKVMDSVAGINVQVLFEFPTNDVQKSLYIYMPDMITVSHSVSRAKIPVTLLGETTISGLGLGTKMVAGSIVKLFTRQDNITQYIKTFVDQRYEKLVANNKLTLADVGRNDNFKEMTDYMRDDIAPFNIHLITTNEYTGGTIAKPTAYKPKIDSIFGCTIINTGKVSSVENLITEETLSFMAKSVSYENDLDKPERSLSVSGKATYTSGSKLLFNRA